MPVRMCEICGKRTAKYVCQDCGREVCQLCLEPRTWVCVECYSRLRQEHRELEPLPLLTPARLFALGFLVVLVGMALIMAATVFSGASAGAGAVIWIFPLPPVALGTGPYAVWAILFALILAVLGVATVVFLRKRA